MHSSLRKLFSDGGMERKTALVFLAVIVFFGAFLRFYNLGERSLGADEFLDMNAAYGYAQTGEWRAWDFNTQALAERVNEASDRRAAVYRWQVAQVLRHFAPTESAARTVSALWSIATLGVIYFVTVSWTRRREVALLAVFLFAVSPAAIEMGRTLRMYASFAPVFLLLSWSVYRMLERAPDARKKWLSFVWKKTGLNAVYVLPVAALGALSFSLHQLTGNIVLILGVYIFVQAIRAYRGKTGEKKYARLLAAGAIAIGALLFFAPQFTEAQLAGLMFFENHFAYFSHISGDWAHPILGILLVFLGAAHLIREKKTEREGVWIAVSLGTLLFAAVFLWRRNVGAQYIFFAMPFAAILAASGVGAAARFFAQYIAAYSARAVVITLALSFLLVPNWGYFFQENNAYRQTASDSEPQYRKIFGFVLKERAPGDALITRDFRSYYFHNGGFSVYDFGGETDKNKLTRERVREAVAAYPNGWVVFSDNDEVFITKDAQVYIEEMMKKVSNSSVRGAVSVYRWGSDQ